MENGDNNFSIIYEKQKVFQGIVENYKSPLPSDQPEIFIQNIALMNEEIGELLKADKRWKKYRNSYFDRQEKLLEMADVFISAINLSIWSGFTAENILDAIENKIDENYKRAKAEKIDQR